MIPSSIHPWSETERTPTGRDTVVVHDGSIYLGGAVDVVLEAARALDADLVVGFSGVEREWWCERAPHRVRVLQRRSRPSTLTDIRTAYRMLRLDLSAYDTVLTSGPSAKFYQPEGDQRLTHYLHHPPLSTLWFDGGLLRYGVKTVDRLETRAIPRLVVNSQLTARRVSALYGREVDAVVEPPVSVEAFRADGDPTGTDVVMVGRLEERKRPRVAVKAFRQLAAEGRTVAGGTPTLHLCGDGPLASTVDRMAPDNVRVHGYVPDDALSSLLADAAAGLFLARREDFGIAPIEYLASGTPVVGVDEPTTNEQVVDGRTGVLVDPQPAAVADGVRRALDRSWDADALEEAARPYGAERFREELRATVRKAESVQPGTVGRAD